MITADPIFTRLDQALAATPQLERERLHAVALAARVRAGADPRLLSTLPIAGRLAALAHVAARGPAGRDALAPVIVEALSEVPWPWPTRALALALWAGLEPERAPDGSTLVAALQTALGWGLAGEDALELAARALGDDDIGSDAVRVAVIETSGDAATSLGVARAITFPALRLHGLFLAALAGAAVAPEEAEAARATVGPEELWPGVADAELAAVTGRAGPLDAAIAALERPMTAATRARLWRVLFRAATRFGVHRWRPLVEQLREDKALLRDPLGRATLLWEATTSARWLETPEARADALGALAEGARRLPDGAPRALVYAEMARLLASVPGRSPSIWLDEAKKVLAQRAGGNTPTDMQLAATLRALAAVDAGAAERVIEGLARPADRALGWIVLAEAAGA